MITVSKIHKRNAILLALLLFGMTIITTAQSRSRPISELFEEFVSDPALNNASVGFYLVQTSTRFPIYGYDEDRSLIPASAQKVITISSALEMFGADHQFETLLAVNGKVANGVLEGDLLLIGKGDPTLGADEFESHYGDLMNKWVTAVQKAGIKKVMGRVIGIDDYFTGEAIAASTPVADAGNYYGAGAHALNYHGNMYHLYFNTGSAPGGLTAVVKMDPQVYGLELINEVTASKINRDQAFIHGTSGISQQVVKGHLPVNKEYYEIKGALYDPPLQVAADLDAALTKAGLTIAMKPSSSMQARRLGGIIPEAQRTLFTIQSPALSEIAKVTLRESDNVYANVLLKHIGKRYYNVGSFKKGVEALYAIWGERGVPLEGWSQVEGSGLSRQNTITAKQLALLTAKVNKRMRPFFLEGLKPLGGNGKIQAKSGYLNGVRSYAGTIDIDDVGHSFAIIVNNYDGSPSTMRKKITALLEEVSKGMITTD